MSATPQVTEKKRRANGIETREALLHAALAIWAEEGLQGVTMEAVAARTGRTRRAAYHHFASQEELLTHARDHVKRHLMYLFDDTRHSYGDPYVFVAGLSANLPGLVASYLQELLLSSPAEDVVLQKATAVLRSMKREGLLQRGFNAEHAAAICVGLWFSAHLVVASHEGEAAHRAAREFGRSFEHLMYHGMFTPAAAERVRQQREESEVATATSSPAAARARRSPRPTR
jgi:AcrR family transcriptional regulator